ncbi:putative germin-like protein 2-3 [Cornus florida]|uniref:putative germin-like protein 2-3 n=1 Tax=Cornus florida TaxID=4283 RepID=UPI00289E4809|nr:putative germin-like protein 2-3 [Cornus florida]
MYAMVCTRLDIAYVVGVVSRRGEVKLHGYVDSYFVGEVDHRRSTTEYVFMVGITAVSWVLQIQRIVALSTTEAEYVVMTEASKEMIWLQVGLIHFQRNVGHRNAVAIAVLSSQNPGVITIANAVFGSKLDISSDILVKAFQLDKNVITYMQSKF